MRKKILFVGGSLNQTTMMHKISIHLKDSYDCYFTPFFTDGYLEVLRKRGLLEFTILGGNFRKQTEEYLAANNLRVDYKGIDNTFDLMFLCTDLIIPKKVKAKKTILVQEGMTDPENIMFYLVKYLKFPRYLASTSVTGLSDRYNYFCVASEGYRDLFISKGVKQEKIIVTGIPNFDNSTSFLNNNLSIKNYALVATSDARETFKYEDRLSFLRKAISLSEGKQIVFKLHPNENIQRAIKEIKSLVPDAVIYTDTGINELVANCDILITQYSSVVYLGLALGKTVHSYFNIDMLKRLAPIQNNGSSARNIADIGRLVLENKFIPEDTYSPGSKNLSINNILNKTKIATN